MRFLSVAIVATTLSVIDAASSSKDIYVHSPTPEVRALTELNPAIKVLAHYIFGSGETVILKHLDGHLVVLKRHEDKFVESFESDANILKHEIARQNLPLSDLSDHSIIRIYEDMGMVSVGNHINYSVSDAITQPIIGSLLNAIWRVGPLRGTAELASEGQVIAHIRSDDSDLILMMSPDLSRFFIVHRNEYGSELKEDKDSIGNNEKLRQHYEVEISRGNIVLEQAGSHTIVKMREKMGVIVLGVTQARSVPAKSEYVDPFLGPRW